VQSNGPMEFDAVVLAGGASRRFDGADKAQFELGGRSLLERAVDTVGSAGRVIVVGPRRPLVRDVTWVQESPPGAGPAHALSAGLELVGADLVAVLACDLPFAGREIVKRLVAAVGSSDGAVVRDRSRRPQPLLAVYRTAALRSRLVGSNTRNAPVREVLGDLKVRYMTDDLAATGCDTPEALRQMETMFSKD
jgi:molybdopterin-guanine dinucleotide biosynthesis protein A